MSGPSSDVRQRLLPVNTHFPGVSAPENSIVFIELSPEAGAPPVRVYMELFHNWAPEAAENVRQMCTGEARRGGARRTQGPATTFSEASVGYKGTRVYESVPGREIVLGDVARGDGTGAAASIYGEGGAFTMSDVPTVTKEKRSLLANTPGVIRLQPVSPVQVLEVGSVLNISVIPPSEMTAQSGEDSWWATVVGRVVGRGEDAAKDVRAALQCLDRTSKVVFRARQASELASLPMVAGCGEM